MYKQIRAFNQAEGGHIAGFCLQNVRKGFGIASKYPNAITAWQHTQQRPNRDFPAGVVVPLYYSYKTDGHINVHLPNGQVWSDGNLYANLADYEAKHPTVHFLGWGESVNDVQVVQFVPDPVTPAPKNVGKILYLPPRNRFGSKLTAWAFYHTNTPLPVKRVNRAGDLNPYKWNGIRYPIEAEVAPNTYRVHSPSLGEILVYADADAQII